MDKIKFADGSEALCSFLSTIPDGTAFVALSGVNFVEAAAIFADPAKTAAIEYGNIRLVGYSHLEGLYVQPYGIQAILKGGHDEIIRTGAETA